MSWYQGTSLHQGFMRSSCQRRLRKLNTGRMQPTLQPSDPGPATTAVLVLLGGSVEHLNTTSVAHTWFRLPSNRAIMMERCFPGGFRLFRSGGPTQEPVGAAPDTHTHPSR